MKIIADENMPNVEMLFSTLGSVELVNGRNLTSEMVKDADVLLVRSVTKITKALLDGSSVRFVGSATIGVDHIDQAYLTEQNIAFSSAPGCNAEAVADYVLSGLSHLYMNKGVSWLGKKVGVLGFGNVGKTVYSRLAAMGCDVCVCDPFKEAAGGVNFVSLDELMTCDVLSLHAPFTRTGDCPTAGMIGAKQLSKLPLGAAIISAGRGGIIDETALMAHHKAVDGDIHLIVDVWQGEPDINHDLLSIVDIATPHIAGYSKQGREKGTWMIYLALNKFLNVESGVDVERNAISAGCLPALILAENSLVSEEILARSVHAIYDVARDDVRLRSKYRENKENNVFDWLRKHYVERDEYNTCTIQHKDEQTLSLLNAASFLIN